MSIISRKKGHYHLLQSTSYLCLYMFHFVLGVSHHISSRECQAWAFASGTACHRATSVDWIPCPTIKALVNMGETQSTYD